MRCKGFTIIELAITIAVMGVLFALMFVNVTNSQARARDEERKSDVEAIAMHLESYYKNGRGLSNEVKGRYPSVAIAGGTVSSVRSYLDDIDSKILYAPDKEQEDGTGISFTAVSSGQVSESITPTIDQYIYQPLMRNPSGNGWSVCVAAAPGSSNDCRKFNIYYRTEADGAVKVVKSRNQ